MLPPRATFALRLMHFLEDVRTGCPRQSIDGRELSHREQMAYDTSVDILRQWIQGSIDLEVPEPTPEEALATELERAEREERGGDGCAVRSK
jgi:hypothetical protein